ncbi:MAG TPA: hypothetical protein VG096_14415 [Bryobacteraceae bacterium]|nr:hypothetical protein [Bryobacteraceae bacterium]
MGKKGPAAGLDLFREGSGETIGRSDLAHSIGNEVAEDSLFRRRQQDVDRSIRTTQHVFAATAVLALIILFAVYFHLNLNSAAASARNPGCFI